ncbi:MAG: outer membrane beta-barrel protein [Rariglobus sp.]
MNTSRFLPLLLAAGLAVSANAQIDPSNDTRPTLQDDVSRQSLNTAAEDGGDFSQLVIANYTVDYRTFVSNDIEFQSNADLNGNSGESAFVWLPTVGGSAVVKFNSPFSVEAAAALQAGLYTDVENLDFWGVNALANLRYEFSKNLLVYGGLEAYDYQSLSGEGELSRGLAPTVGVRYTRQVIDARTFLFAGARVQHHFVSPSFADRDVFVGTFALTRQLTSDFFAQGFYEYRHSDFINGGRKDNRNTVGASLIYVPTKKLRMNTGVTFSDNDSNVAPAQFQTVNVGLGATLTWDF